ncbi:MAG: TolC family protein [Bacteroidetes bacterium]|nr:TolC family protein [Bacteroidota bacterium]
MTIPLQIRFTPMFSIPFPHSLCTMVLSLGALLCAFFVFPQASHAQEALRLSLDSARQYALEYNRTLVNADLSVDEASARLRETVAQGLPQVNATMDYSNFFGSSASLGNFPGMRITFNPTSNLGVTVSQLVFSGSYIVGIQSAKLYREMMRVSREKTRTDILAQVTEAYSLCLVSERIRQGLEENLANMQTILGQTKVMVDVGMAEELDYDQLAVQVGTIDDALKAAERQVEISLNMLRLMLGIPAERDIILTGNIERMIGSTDFHTSLQRPFILQKNPEYRMMTLQEEIAQRAVRMEQSAFLPTITGFYSFTEKLLKPEFDITPKHVIGLNLSLPLFTSGLRAHRIEQAQLNREIAQNQHELLTQELAIREKQLRYNLNNALDQYENRRANRDVAKKVFANMNNKFRQGMVSALDLTMAHNSALQAENNYYSALLQLMQAQVALDKLQSALEP